MRNEIFIKKLFSFSFSIFRYLEYSLNGNISLDYVPFVWQSISHSVGVRTGFQFLRLNWERINDAYQGVYLVFSSIFHDFLSQLSTEVDLEDVSKYYMMNSYYIICSISLIAHHFLQTAPRWPENHGSSTSEHSW